MKVRFALLAGAAAALAVAGGSASAKTPVRAGAAANACTASLAIEGPFTGPVAQLGLEQLHFAQLAVANENKALKMHVSLAQDDTQLDTVACDDQDAVDHRFECGRGRSARRAVKRWRRSDRCSGAPGWRSSRARRRCRRWLPVPTRRSSAPCRMTTSRAHRTRITSSNTCTLLLRAARRRRRGLLAGSRQSDDADPAEGGHQG